MNSFARDFPIVCVGGLAGGSAAYVQLLKHLPTCRRVLLSSSLITQEKRPPRSTKFSPALRKRRLS